MQHDIARIQAGSDNWLMTMKIPALLLAAVLACACASLDDTSYMPSESQLKWSNPRLLNCPSGSVVKCDAAGGGRVGKRYTNCTCAIRL